MSIYEVDFEGLLSRGITGLLIDIDNTLASYDTPEPPKQAAELLDRLRGEGFAICLFSNNNAERVERFSRGLGLCAVSNAGKPGKRGVGQALELIGKAPGQAAVIGDQLFTDVWAGNRCGLRSILVKPMSDRDEWMVRLKRAPERLVMKLYLRGGKAHD